MVGGSWSEQDEPRDEPRPSSAALRGGREDGSTSLECGTPRPSHLHLTQSLFPHTSHATMATPISFTDPLPSCPAKGWPAGPLTPLMPLWLPAPPSLTLFPTPSQGLACLSPHATMAPSPPSLLAARLLFLLLPPSWQWPLPITQRAENRRKDPINIKNNKIKP